MTMTSALPAVSASIPGRQRAAAPVTAPEHGANRGKALNRATTYEPVAGGNPVHVQAAIDESIDIDGSLSVADFREITDEWAHLMTSTARDRVRMAKRSGPFITLPDAQRQLDSWRSRALEQGADPEMHRQNSSRTILSLFDYTGQWARPWAEAGYNVLAFDIQHDPEHGDVHKFCVEFFTENFDISDVYGILAACPCTDFAVSGARHFAKKDADGRTEASKDLVFQTLRTVEYFRPRFWAIENPVGRIEALTGLPPWRLAFEPHHFGAPYTKKTLIWGRFNAQLPSANVRPSQGSKMHKLYGGSSQKTKNARSETPRGFAYAFFLANNYLDLLPVERMTGNYPEASGAVRAALKAGVTESRIHELMEDTYGNYEYKAARDALAREVAKLQVQRSPAPRARVVYREQVSLFA